MPRLPVPSVLNGVGRQPPTVRRLDHFDEATNVRFDIQTGATKRAGFESVEYFSPTDLAVTYGTDVATEWTDRDAVTRYLIVWKEQEGRANGSANATIPFDIIDISDGSKATINWAAGDATSADNKAISDYLNFVDADVTGDDLTASDVVMITAGDTTFFLNKTAVTGFDTSDPNIVDLNVTGTHGSDQNLTEIKQNNNVGSVEDAGSAANDPSYFWADRDVLESPAVAQLGLYYYNSSFNTTWGSGVGGTAADATARWVDSVDQLPNEFFGHTTAGVGVDAGATTEYVQVKTSSAFGPLGWYRGTKASNSFTWEQFPPLDVSNCYIDNTTMPVRLVRQSDGTFELSLIDWIPRYNGDEETNPAPSFMGQTITDIVFFQNRLCFLSGENFIASQSGSYFNFFLQDYTNIVDSDPIDVASSINKVVEGQFFGIVDRNLYILSKSDVQFEVQYSVDVGLSPLTISLVPVTSYQTSNTVRPVSSGDALYFVSDEGSYTSLYEFFETTPQDTPTVAYNVSLHTNTYLTETYKWMTGDAENRIVILGSDDTIAIYQYYWQQQQRLQQAWSKWTTSEYDTFISGKVYDDDFYVLIRQEASDTYYWHLVKMDLKVTPPEAGMPYYPILDFMTRVTSGYTYDIGTNTTTIVLSDYFDTGSDDHEYAVVYGVDSSEVDDDEYGVWRPLDSPTANAGAGTLTFTISDNLTDRDYLYIGRLVDSSLDINPPFLRDRNGLVLAVGTTDIVSLTLNYMETGQLSVNTTHQGGQVYSESHEPYTVGASVASGPPVITDGQHKFVIFGNNRTTNVTITNNVPLPFTIGSMEWELNYREGER